MRSFHMHSRRATICCNSTEALKLIHYLTVPIFQLHEIIYHCLPHEFYGAQIAFITENEYKLSCWKDLEMVKCLSVHDEKQCIRMCLCLNGEPKNEKQMHEQHPQFRQAKDSWRDNRREKKTNGKKAHKNNPICNLLQLLSFVHDGKNGAGCCGCCCMQSRAHLHPFIV